MDTERKSFHYISRKKGESAAEYKLRKQATINRYRKEDSSLIEIPSQHPSYYTIGFWDSRLKKWVGGCKPKFVDERWTGMYIVECPWCGQPFETKDPRRRYCPDKPCKREMFIYQRKLKNPRLREQRCHNCGGIMEKRRGAQFCCNLCTVIHHRREKKMHFADTRSHIFSSH